MGYVELDLEEIISEDQMRSGEEIDQWFEIHSTVRDKPPGFVKKIRALFSSKKKSQTVTPSKRASSLIAAEGTVSKAVPTSSTKVHPSPAKSLTDKIVGGVSDGLADGLADMQGLGEGIMGDIADKATAVSGKIRGNFESSGDVRLKLKYDQARGILEVTVVQARKLKNVNLDVFGPSDPFIKLVLAPERGIADSLFNEFNELVFGKQKMEHEYETTHKTDTLFPVWNETFEFKVDKTVEDKVLIMDVHDGAAAMFVDIDGTKMVNSRDQLLRVLAALNLTNVYTPDLHMIEAVATNANIEEWYPVTIAHIHPSEDEPETAELASFDVVYADDLLPKAHRLSITQETMMDGLKRERNNMVPFHYLRGFEGGFLPDELKIGQIVDCRYRGQAKETECKPCTLEAVKEAYLKFKKDTSADRTTLSAIVLLFLIYPNVSKLVLQFLQCDSLGTKVETLPGGGTAYVDLEYMVTDFDTACWDRLSDKEHTFWTIVIGGSSFLLYVIGIPLGGFLSLYVRRNMLGMKRIKMQFGFLYDGYETQYYYWEIFGMVRKLIVVAIVLMPLPDGGREVGALMICIVFLYIHLRNFPYEDDLLDKLEQYGWVTNIFTVYVGTLCSLEILDASYGMFIATCIFGGNFCFASYFIRVGYGDIYKKVENTLDKVRVKITKQPPKAAFKRAIAFEDRTRVVKAQLDSLLVFEGVPSEKMQVDFNGYLEEKGLKPDGAKYSAERELASTIPSEDLNAAAVAPPSSYDVGGAALSSTNATASNIEMNQDLSDGLENISIGSSPRALAGGNVLIPILMESSAPPRASKDDLEVAGDGTLE